MIGGGISYTLAKSSSKDVTTCLMEAIARPDTRIKPLTFSSLSGFIMIMHRPGGLVDADGTVFLRSTTVKTNGKSMVRSTTTVPIAGMVVDTIIIKFMIMSDKNLKPFNYQGNTFKKGNVTEDEVLAEQRNHMAVYSAFNAGDRQIIPSIVGNIVSLTNSRAKTILEFLEHKSPEAKHEGSIIAFKYFVKELTRLKDDTKLVAIFIEKVGHDSGSDDYLVVNDAISRIRTNTRNEDSIFKDESPARGSRGVDAKIEGRRKRNVIRAAAVGACAMQIMTMNKTKPMMLLVDAHNGNWFINNRDPTKFFAIDFGRLVQVDDRATMAGLYSTYLAKNFASTAGVPPAGSVFFPDAMFDSVYDDFIQTVLNSDSFSSRGKSDASKKKAFENVHKCLVMAAIIDNIITDDTYADWNQPQMAWAYRQIWGYPESLDKNDKQPISNFPNLSIDYGAFSSPGSIPKNQLAHVKKSYEALCNVIVEVNATVATGAFESRPDSTTTKPQTIVAMGGGSRHRRKKIHSHNTSRRTLKNKN